MLQIRKFVFNLFQVNTFLIFDAETREGAVIDPGCSDANEEAQLVRAIENENVEVKFIVNTHLHIDHIFGNDFLAKRYGAQLVYPQADEFLLDIMIDEASKYGISRYEPSPKADVYTEDVDYLEIGAIRLKPLFTPGHTSGEYLFYCADESLCFTGDVLFKESIGRTDLWNGDYDLLIESIYNKLFVLPDEVTVYPGHGPLTTIGYEKKFNPFL